MLINHIPEQSSVPFLHFFHIRKQLRALRDDCRINILDHKALLIQQPFDCLQKLHTGSPLLLWIGVREMLPDIPECRCPEQCIHDRMQCHICIGMSEQSFFIRNLYPAENQFSSFYQTMYVITISNSHNVSPPNSANTDFYFVFYQCTTLGKGRKVFLLNL